MKQLIQDLQGLGFEGLFTYHPYELVETGEMVDNQPVYTSDRNMDRLEIAPRNEYFYLCDAQRWLREEKEVFIWLKRYDGFWECVVEGCMSRSIEKTYGEALQKGIEEAVKILKEQNKQ